MRWLALASAVAAWALVGVGAFVRITESGLGCPDWPLCEGRLVPGGDGAAAIEFTHRAVAALVTALVVILALLAWRRHRSRLDILVPAAVAAALIPGQAILGAAVVWLELPAWIVGLHFVVGMVFLAAAVLTAVAAWGHRRTPAAGFGWLAVSSAGLGLLLVGAGAAVVSAHADAACGRQWPGCNGAFVAGGSDAVVQVVHRTLAYALLVLLIALAVGAWRGRGPPVAGSLPLVAAAAQAGLGVSLVLAGEENRAAEALAALHVAGAGAVWALIVALAWMARPATRPLSKTVRAGFRVPV